ncbi:MAG: hypothetical protein ACR2OJ_03770 [Hyphomicrobiales bacterium]
MTSACQVWIDNGKPIELAPELGNSDDATHLMRQNRMVLLAISSSGTVVRWYLEQASWASLFFVIDYLKSCPPPYQLDFYKEGWIVERYTSCVEAMTRLETLMSKADVKIHETTYIKEMNPGETSIPALLRHALSDASSLELFRVDCAYDDRTDQFHVESIGEKSSIARWFGHDPESYATRTGHEYDSTVSKAYLKVLENWRPHYDHVYALMNNHVNGNRFWAPYQRVVVPHKFHDHRYGVSVITQVGEVDISLM